MNNDNYTWEQINKALMAKGMAPKNIANVLSTLVTIAKVEKEIGKKDNTNLYEQQSDELKEYIDDELDTSDHGDLCDSIKRNLTPTDIRGYKEEMEELEQMRNGEI